jgi:hypothetical protein
MLICAVAKKDLITIMADNPKWRRRVCIYLGLLWIAGGIWYVTDVMTGIFPSDNAWGFALHFVPPFGITFCGIGYTLNAIFTKKWD